MCGKNLFLELSVKMLLVNQNTVFLNFNPLSTNFTKWSNTLKQFVGNLLMNCLSVFGDFVGLALKGLIFQKLLEV